MKKKQKMNLKQSASVALLALGLGTAAFIGVRALTAPKYKVGDCMCSLDRSLCAQILEVKDGVYKARIFTFLGEMSGTAKINAIDKDPNFHKVNCETGEPDEKAN